MDKALLLAGARSLVRTLNDKLHDVSAGTIALDRDDAVLALGFVEAAAELLHKELQRDRPG